MISITAQIDEYIGILDEQHEPDGMLHPSWMWHCDRRAVFAMRGVPQSDPGDLRLARHFRVGHTIHDFVRDAVMSSPDLVRVFAEFEVMGSRIRGHGDLLLGLEDGTYIVVETKSMSRIRKVVPRDLHQAMSYAVGVRMHGFTSSTGEVHQGLGEKLIGVVILYVDKTNLTIREEFVRWDPAWPQKVGDRVTLLDAYGNDPGSLPPRLASPKKGQRHEDCYRCPWVTRCFRQDGAGVEPVAEVAA